jgi:hypothetical protein
MRSIGHRKLFTAGVAISALVIALPAILFYGILFRHLVNIPYGDDYSVPWFLNQLVEAKSPAARLLVFLAAQHNEYKLFFVDGVAWAQFALLGHVNFAQLCVLGDSAVLVLALILWSMFLPGHKDLARRLALFVPVAWLLFQMEYWETLNWALASLQNLWVIVFSLGAIQMLLHPARRAYACALGLYVLAISASGNGFFVLAVGLVILAKRRQFARVGGMLALSGLCIAAYAYHYNFMSSQELPGASVFSELRYWRPDFAIAFVGNAGTIAGESVTAALRHLIPGFSIPFESSAGTFVSESAIDMATCLALGTSLLALFGWLVWRGYVSRNPRVSSSVLFLLLTAVGVTGLRSGLGPEQCLSPRYAIYGTLLLILAWMACAEEFLQHRSEALRINGAYLAIAVLTIALTLEMDRAGTKNLAQREHELANGMQAFEHPARPGSTEGPVLDEDPSDARWSARAREVLTDSIRLGVYEPPRL